MGGRSLSRTGYAIRSRLFGGAPAGARCSDRAQVAMNMHVGHLAPTLVGHPYGTSGRSEDVREVYRALRKVGRQSIIYDVYRHERPVRGLQEELGRAVSEKVLPGVRIFLLNGDEVKPACHTIEMREPG